MTWKRETDNSISINKVVRQYVCGDFRIELEYGSLQSNSPTGFDLYNDSKFIMTCPTLSEAKIFAEIYAKKEGVENG